MEILTPEKIQSDKEVAVQEQKSRVIRTAEEEARIIRELNDAHDLEEKEVETKKSALLTEIAPLEDKKKRLEDDCITLEKRRADAMRPIYEIRTEAEDVLRRAKEKMNSIDAIEVSVRSKEDLADKKLDELDEASDILVERSSSLDKREQNIANQEQWNRTSTDELSAKWLSYHQAVKQFDDAVIEKELRIASRESACAIKETDLSVKEADLSNREIQVADRYQTLQYATEDFEKRKQQNP